MNAAHNAHVSVPPLSRRAESLGTENAFVVLAEVNALVREGKDIVSFCIGQPDFPTPTNVQDAAIAAIRGGKHGYTPSAGIDELRAAAAKDIGARRGIEVAPEDVVVGAGAKPFIAYAIASVTDYGAGDEVIYPVPGFPIYESQIVANGAVPVPIYLRESRDFAFDPAELEAKITAKTRLLILNTPHNPTGGMLQAADLDAIAEILRQHPQVWVYADEIYSRLAYAGAFDTLARRPGMQERTIISDGASKTWAMTGWRIGFTANRVARAGVHALDHQHGLLRVADLAVGGGRGDHRTAGCRQRDARELPRAARPDRRTAEPGARHFVQGRRAARSTRGRT